MGGGLVLERRKWIAGRGVGFEEAYVGVSLRRSVETPENPLKSLNWTITSPRLESLRPWAFEPAGAKRDVIGDAIVQPQILFQNKLFVENSIQDPDTEEVRV